MVEVVLLCTKMHTFTPKAVSECIVGVDLYKEK